ncbi:MAG TPA: tetratricopeptide repeat protein [Polyangiaceae bacterium]|nr:tetratricopeptide repeat protein [Polyangiaceae bacterium]
MPGSFRRSCLLLALVLGAAGCSATAPLPPQASALNRAGAEALAQGDLDTAEARLSVALEYNASFVEALTNLGLVEVQRGNFGRALELLERARRINADIAQPHHALGVLREREGRADLASRHYQDALRVDPGFAPARANYARMLFAAGMLEHARTQFLRLTEVAPQEPSGHAGLAECLLRLGRISEADRVVARGLARHADSPSLRILEARRLMRQGELDSAVARLTPLTRARDDASVAAFSWLAVAELAQGNTQAASRAAESAARLNPNDALAVYALATVLAEIGDPRAPTWTQRARALAPPQISPTRGLAQARTASP